MWMVLVSARWYQLSQILEFLRRHDHKGSSVCLAVEYIDSEEIYETISRAIRSTNKT
jgi:hypothetical protein